MADEITKLSLNELEKFASAVEYFKVGLEKRCSNMETGIQSCSKYMKDATSQHLLGNAAQTVAEIRECLNPAEAILEKVLYLIDLMQAEL